MFKLQGFPPIEDIKKVADEAYIWLFAREKNPTYETLKWWLKFKQPAYACVSKRIFNICVHRLVANRRINGTRIKSSPKTLAGI